MAKKQQKLSPFQQRLADLNESWKNAQVEAANSSYGSIPDGKYLFKLTEAEITESRSSERLQVKWVWEVLEGEQAGESKYDFDGLETEQNLIFLARKLARLGYDPEDVDLANLETILEELVSAEVVVQATLKKGKKSDYQNFYIDKMVDDYEGSEDESEEEEEEEEPAPKPKSGKGKRKPEPEPEPEEDEDEDETEDEESETEDDDGEEEEVEDEDEDEDESDEDESEDEEETEDEDEDEGVELEPGMKVQWEKNGKEFNGTFQRWDDDGVNAVVKPDGKKGTVKVPADDLLVLDDELDE